MPSLPPPAAPDDEVVVAATASGATASGSGVVLPNRGRLQGVLLAPAPGVLGRELALAQQAPTLAPLALRGPWQPGQVEPGTAPAAGIGVTAYDLTGRAVSREVLTDAQGSFVLDGLAPSGPLLQLRATLAREGCVANVIALAPAPRPAGYVAITMSPATTLVALKAQRAIRARTLSPLLLPTALTDRFATTFAGVLSDRSLTAAVCLREDRVSALFDAAFAALPPDVQATLRNAALQLDAAALMAPAAEGPIETLPTRRPSEPPPPYAPDPVATDVTPPAPTPARDAVAPPTPPPPDRSPPRGTLATLGQARSAARLAMSADGDALFAPWVDGLESGRLIALDAPLTLRELERTATAVAFDAGTRHELSGDVLVWDDYAVPVPGTGAVTYADVAVREGLAYLIGVEPHNVVRVRLESGEADVLAGPAEAGSGSFQDGLAAEARFHTPAGLVAAPDALYVADTGNHRIRRVTYEGEVSTFAGGAAGHADGLGPLARFQSPADLTQDDQGNLYVVDSASHCVRWITPGGLVRTLTGTTQGEADGGPGTGQLDTPVSITLGRVDTEQVLVIGQANGKLRLLRGW
ncbi:MAG: hypothetical protein VKQ33_11580 [Candidatus Sericytochromatia bacterium]|nr:hypothetical protein [Candidatus Sericytochromatia bacterium]